MTAPKNAENLRILREMLGLSQAQMGIALGGYTQSTYAMWEKKSRTPGAVRETLFSAGVDLNWFDTGDGPMLRPGIARVQVVRDEQTGKATALKSVSEREEKPINTGVISPLSEALTAPQLHEAKSLVDEIIMGGANPANDTAYWDLVALAGQTAKELRALGKEDEIRPRLRRWLQVAEARPE